MGGLKLYLQAALKRGELDDVYHGLNCLGKVPWSINRFVLDVAQRCWVEGVVLGDIPPREDFEMPSLPEERPNKPPSYVDKSSPEYIQYKEDIQNYIIAVSKYRKTAQKNMDLRSLRCRYALTITLSRTFTHSKFSLIFVFYFTIVFF